MTVVFITLPNTKIELLEPLGSDSPIAKFLERNPDGGIHHVCYEVPDIRIARDKLKAQGARVLGSGEPKIGTRIDPYSASCRLRVSTVSGTLIRFSSGLSSEIR